MSFLCYFWRVTRIRVVEDFGAVARQRRRDLDLSQDALAKRAGVTRQWLVRFEQGNPDVSLSKVFAVVVELGLTLRTDPSESRSRTTDMPSFSFTIPRIELSHIGMDALRATLDAARDIPTQQTLAGLRETITLMSAARSDVGKAGDDGSP